MILRISPNPFLNITDSKTQPYSRLLRSSIWTKFQDTYRVIMGNMGYIDNKIDSPIANDNASQKYGIVDLLLFGFLLKAVFVLAYLLQQYGIHYGRGGMYDGWHKPQKWFITFFSGLAMAIIVAPIILALIIPTIAIGLALLTVSFLSVPVVHAISAIAADKHAKLIIEMFEKGLLKKENPHQPPNGDQIVSKKAARLFYREFCSLVDRRKMDAQASLPNKAVYTSSHPSCTYTLDKSIVPPGSLSMFADRMTSVQTTNLKYTEALKALNMFTHQNTVSLAR